MAERIINVIVENLALASQDAYRIRIKNPVDASIMLSAILTPKEKMVVFLQGFKAMGEILGAQVVIEPLHYARLVHARRNVIIHIEDSSKKHVSVPF